MDRKTGQPTRRRQRDPLTDYIIGCASVIFCWLAVAWAVVHIAPW